MPITAAPRLRSRSTVRLVSVVVPLWLTATASVSLMSRRMPKPDSSVAVIGVDVELPDASARRGWWPCSGPATAAVPWPMTRIRVIDPSARRAAIAGGSARSPTRRDSSAVAFDDLAAQGLGEAERRLGDLLQQEVRCVAAVDVAGGDLGGDDVVVAHRQVGAVVGEAPHDRRACPRRRADTTTISPPCSPSRRTYCARLLDHAVRLAGDDEQSSARPM